MRRPARIAGTLLIVAGIALLAWTATVWRWQDPFTAATHALDQRRLSDKLEQQLAAADRAPGPAIPVGASADEMQEALARQARGWRSSAQEGDPIARLRLPTLGVTEVVVNGTDSATLKKGPGRYLGSAMPGEDELVYIAGHRTTYGAPFSKIDHLRKGDPVVIELPYGAFRYRITGFRIVKDTDLSVLKSKGFEQLALQACHPRFFASHRYIAYAKLVGVTPVQAGPEAAGRSY